MVVLKQQDEFLHFHFWIVELLNKFLSEEERKLQFVLAPSHWGRQVSSSTVKTSSSSSSPSSSTSKDVVRTSIPNEYQELVQNTQQLCNEIATAVQPFANENIDDIAR